MLLRELWHLPTGCGLPEVVRYESIFVLNLFSQFLSTISKSTWVGEVGDQWPGSEVVVES